MDIENKTPPKWPIEALVAVVRATLVERGSWTSQRPFPPVPVSKGKPPPSLSGESEARIYPFTKGLDLTNDGIGYGEETTVTVRRADGTIEVQRRRRTRTGSIVLAPLPTPAAAEALSSKPKRLASTVSRSVEPSGDPTDR